MRTLLFWLCLAGLCVAAEPLFEQSSFHPGPDGQPEDREVWTPRRETAPRTFLDQVHYLKTPGSLAISGGSNIAACGGWERVVQGIEAGRWYRFVAHYRTEGLRYEPAQVVPRLDWLSSEGKRAGRPDYPYALTPAGDWTRIAIDAPAPPGATAVRVQLLLWNAPTGTLWWDEISLTPVPAPEPRLVTIASINLRPRSTGSAEASVSKFIETVDKIVQRKTDIILLPEAITVIGSGKKYVEVAEPVPGPTTQRLGELARRHNSYVAAGIFEREGVAVYNTAVLLDRSGNLVGKYRKVYVPREETEGGVTPGADYPVFQTDFGKVGMIICWDIQYADPARALALGGAEIILAPIWGGNETLAKARAIENHLFLVSSGYDYPTHVIDPDGKVISVATEEGAAAFATVDLNHRYLNNWLGHMHDRFMKELRLDVPVEPAIRVR